MLDFLLLLIFVWLLTILSSILCVDLPHYWVSSLLFLIHSFFSCDVTFLLISFFCSTSFYFSSCPIFELSFQKVQILFNFLECAKQLQTFYTIFKVHFVFRYPFYLNFICFISLLSFWWEENIFDSFHFWMGLFWLSIAHFKIVWVYSLRFFFPECLGTH